MSQISKSCLCSSGRRIFSGRKCYAIIRCTHCNYNKVTVITPQVSYHIVQKLCYNVEFPVVSWLCDFWLKGRNIQRSWKIGHSQSCADGRKSLWGQKSSKSADPLLLQTEYVEWRHKGPSPHLYVRACRLFYLLGLSAGSEQWRSNHCNVVWQSSALLAVDTIPLKESKRGLIMMLNWMYDSQGGTLNLITQLRLIKIGFKCKRPRGIKKMQCVVLIQSKSYYQPYYIIDLESKGK